jgi:hypothetical protein
MHKFQNLGILVFLGPEPMDDFQCRLPSYVEELTWLPRSSVTPPKLCSIISRFKAYFFEAQNDNALLQ